MDNGQVAVDVDVGKEQNGVIYVVVEDDCGGSVYDFFKYLVVFIEVVGYFKGQRDIKKKICNGQVGVEDGYRDGFGFEEEYLQGYRIGWRIYYKYQDVDGRYQFGI